MNPSEPEIVRCRIGDETSPTISLSLRRWAAKRGVEGPSAQSGPAGRAPFLLLHGLASTAVSWDEVAPHLAGSGRGVFALDFRGHGQSDCPDDGYDLATYAADVAAVIERLSLAPPVIAGHSLGAMVGLELLRSTPRAASALALIEGGLVDASIQFDSLAECQARVALPRVDGMPKPRVEGFLRSSNPGWSAARLSATMAAFQINPDGTVSWRLTRPRLESLVESMWRQKAEGLWPLVECPSLIVFADTGDARWTGQKRAAAAVATGRMPDARVASLEAAHDVHMDRPDEVAELLLALADRAV